jgi:DNA-binding response OmpR family regulator
MKLKILVFDDDEDIRNLLKTALEGKGHEVTALADPTEFKFFDETNCPCPQGEPCADVLIADIVMPNMEGIEFCKKLKAAGCWPLNKGNVAIISGYLTIHYMNELNDMGIHYLRKPFELNEIFTWIEECESRMEENVS